MSLDSLTLFIWLFVGSVMNSALDTLQSRSGDVPKVTKEPLKTAPGDKTDLNSIKMFQSPFQSVKRTCIKAEPRISDAFDENVEQFRRVNGFIYGFKSFACFNHTPI